VKQSTTPALQFLDDALAEARRQHLLREHRPPETGEGISFCSNDYLALAREVAPPGASGAGASRLLGGDRPVHASLETASARLVGLDQALVFSSGYAANLGLVSCLAGAGDLIVSDELNHGSIIDGVRLSRAERAVYKHADTADLARVLDEAEKHTPPYRRILVITDGVFSMDGDIAPLDEIAGVGPTRVRPGRRAADHGQLHGGNVRSNPWPRRA